LGAWKRGVEVSRSGELREYPAYHEDDSECLNAWHLSREIRICDKAHLRGRTQARVLTGDESQWVLPRVFERSGGIYAKLANGRSSPTALGIFDRGFANDNSVVGEQAVVSVNRRIVGNPEVGTLTHELTICSKWLQELCPSSRL
jgi:hypothetical protein